MYDWDDNNINHILEEHGLEPFEIEEALEDPSSKSQGAYNTNQEKRFALIGATEAGRILFVVYTIRENKIRPITAFDAKDNMKRRYRRD